MMNLNSAYLELVAWLTYANPPPAWVAMVAGVFVLTSRALFLFLLFEHLPAYKIPEDQKFLIGVILIVPCYAAESLVSLMKPSTSVDCEILRDCYESFAMEYFGRYLVACLGGEERTVEFMERQGIAAMIIKSLTAILAVILETFGYIVKEKSIGDVDTLIWQLFEFQVLRLLFSLGLFKNPVAQALQVQSNMQDFIICIETGIVPLSTYSYFQQNLMNGWEKAFMGASLFMETIQLLIVPWIQTVNDVKFTVTQAVEKKHDKDKKQTRDDRSIASMSMARRVIRGIDDLLLKGSFSDSGRCIKGKEALTEVRVQQCRKRWGKQKRSELWGRFKFRRSQVDKEVVQEWSSCMSSRKSGFAHIDRTIYDCALA